MSRSRLNHRYYRPARVTLPDFLTSRALPSCIFYLTLRFSSFDVLRQTFLSSQTIMTRRRRHDLDDFTFTYLVCNFRGLYRCVCRFTRMVSKQVTQTVNGGDVIRRGILNTVSTTTLASHPLSPSLLFISSKPSPRTKQPNSPTSVTDQRHAVDDVSDGRTRHQNVNYHHFRILARPPLQNSTTWIYTLFAVRKGDRIPFFSR